MKNGISFINTGAFETKKIDLEPVNGLLGVENSLAYRVHEIERHLHSSASWFGAAITPSGEIHIADRIGAGVIPFVCTAGNNDWGSWLQVMGSGDTPARGSAVKFDPHIIQITSTNDSVTYFFQMARGDSGAAGYAAGTYTESVFTAVSNQIDSAPIDFQTGRAPAGSKLWARCLAVGVIGKTISFYYGIHEYEG